MQRSAIEKTVTPATALLGLFFMVTLVAPTAPLNKLLFVVLGAWLLKDMLFARPTLSLLAAPFIVLAIFTYGFVLSWANDTNGALALQFFTSAYLLFLILFVLHHSIDVDRLVETSAVVLLIFTALYWIGTLWPDLPLLGTLRDLLDEYGAGSSSERDFLEEGPTLSLALGTAPFLFVAFCLRVVRFFESYRWQDATLLLALCAGIVLSASRGLIGISALFVMVAVLGRLPPVARLIALMGAATVTYLVAQYILANSQLLSSDEVSNAVKIGHVQSYFTDLTLASAMAGRGLASYYYSTGSGAFMAHTEITPLDMARYVGVILTTVLYLAILFPSTQLHRYGGRNRIWVVAFVLYMALSATNPVMFNSYGMLVVLWYWYKVCGGSVPTAPARAPQGAP